jgi:undecaprenyl-diphosphatase
MLDGLIMLDQAATLAINQASNPTGDFIMSLISAKSTWVPLYLGLLLLLHKIFGWKRSLLLVVFIVLNLVLTDQISVLFKDTFERLRPCHEPGFADLLHLPDGCGGRYGFVSSHAANTMGLAVLVSLILKNRLMTYAMLAFALANAYSRVYLGKHYVLDVICGALLGLVLAGLMYQALLWSIKKFKFT